MQKDWRLEESQKMISERKLGANEIANMFEDHASYSSRSVDAMLANKWSLQQLLSTKRGVTYVADYFDGRCYRDPKQRHQTKYSIETIRLLLQDPILDAYTVETGGRELIAGLGLAAGKTNHREDIVELIMSAPKAVRLIVQTIEHDSREMYNILNNNTELSLALMLENETMRAGLKEALSQCIKASRNVVKIMGGHSGI